MNTEASNNHLLTGESAQTAMAIENGDYIIKQQRPLRKVIRRQLKDRGGAHINNQRAMLRMEEQNLNNPMMLLDNSHSMNSSSTQNKNYSITSSTIKNETKQKVTHLSS